MSSTLLPARPVDRWLSTRGGSAGRGLEGKNGAMASTNEEVAALLREYAELLGLTGSDQFRVRSYEKAAKAVAGYPDDLGALPEKALTRVPGVGSSVAAKIAEYRRTGTIKAIDDLRDAVPPGTLLLAKVPGVGPKTRAAGRRRTRHHQRERVGRGGQERKAARGGRIRPEERGAHPARHRAWRPATPRCAGLCARFLPKPPRTIFTRSLPLTS